MLITIRFNCPIIYYLFIKFLKLLLTTNSSVTKTTNAYLYGLRLFYLTHLIPAFLYHVFISPLNKINRITITITPIEYNAGSINNMLFPALIPIITITRLFYYIITFITTY